MSSNALTAYTLSNLAHGSVNAYQQTRDIEYLDEAIGITHLAVDMLLEDGLRNTDIDLNLMELLRWRSLRRFRESDLDLGIAIGDASLKALGLQDPHRSRLIRELAMRHEIKYDRNQTKENLDELIKYVDLDLKGRDQAHPDVWPLQMKLSECYFTRYLKQRDLKALSHSMELADAALQKVPPGNGRFVTLLTLSGLCYSHSFEHADHDSLKIINRAIVRMEEAVRLTPLEGMNKTMRKLLLLQALLKRARFTSRKIDIDDTIRLAEELKQGLSPGSQWAIETVYISACALWLRYEISRSVSDADLAIETLEKVVTEAPTNLDFLCQLGFDLRRRFEDFSADTDLERSINVLRKANTLRNSRLPNDQYVTTAVLLESGQSLVDRFLLKGDIEDLNEGISLAKRALNESGHDSSSRQEALRWLSLWLRDRFEDQSHLDDVDASIHYIERLYEELSSEEHRTHVSRQLLTESVNLNFAPQAVANLATAYGRRYQWFGNPDDLNRAIEGTNDALKAVPQKSRWKGQMQSHLAAWLFQRYVRFRALEDLTAAAAQQEDALNSIPLQDPRRLIVMCNLANYFRSLAERLDSQSYLERGISVMTTVVAQTPPDYPQAAGRSGLLAAHLKGRAIFDGTPGDINEIIELSERAVQNFPEGRPQVERISFVYNLASSLLERFRRTNHQNLTDLDRAIENLETIMQISTTDTFDIAQSHFMLAQAYKDRSTHNRDTAKSDEELALHHYKQSFLSRNSDTVKRVLGAHDAAMMLLRTGKQSEALEIIKKGIDLIPLLTSRHIARSDQEYTLSRGLVGLPAAAAGLALSLGAEPYEALRFLEVGRGVLAGFAMETRPDMSLVEPDLASKFLELRADLETQPQNTPSFPEDSEWVRSSQSRYKKEAEFLKIIDEIRAKPETRGFLGPPTTDELKRTLGDDTIVVVNEYRLGYDAFLIDRKKGVRTMRLEKLRYEDIYTWVSFIGFHRPRIDTKMLEWLWDSIAGPILNELGFHYSPQPRRLPRIFWILVGRLSLFPIHAAGRHECRSETVIDRVVSSYSSSLKAFVHSRSKNGAQSTSHDKQRALLVGMEQSSHRPAQDPLPFVKTEIEAINKIYPRLGMDITTLYNATRKEVLGQLTGCSIFHYAGHAFSHRTDPSSSGLLLDDGPITVGDLQACKFPQEPPFLAYLSACLTNTNDVPKLRDEGVNLVSTFQLSGFRHVIGTLWQVYDDASVKITETVYTKMADEGICDESVCLGLHQALVQQRDIWVNSIKDFNAADRSIDNSLDEEGKTNEPERDERGGRLIMNPNGASVRRLLKAEWIPYVHYGP